MTGVGGEARCAKKTVMPDINMPGGHDIGGKKQEIDFRSPVFFLHRSGISGKDCRPSEGALTKPAKGPGSVEPEGRGLPEK